MDTVEIGKHEGGHDLEAKDLERRRARLQELWNSIDADLDSVPRKPWPEGDPVIEKYRRKGLLD